MLSVLVEAALDILVLSFMTKQNGDWVCTACGFTKKRKDYVVDHVEAKVGGSTSVLVQRNNCSTFSARKNVGQLFCNYVRWFSFVFY